MFFFFKPKTAYEMLGSLVGSEMCISGGAGGPSHDMLLEPGTLEDVPHGTA